MLLKKINLLRDISLLLLGLPGMQLNIAAQATTGKHVGYVDPYLQKIDTSRAVPVVYPLLTAREGKGLAIPEPPREHPRLYFRGKDKPELKGKQRNALLKESWEAITRSASLATDGRLQQGLKHNIDAKIINAIEARAFLYALEQQESVGKAAIALLMNMNSSLVIDYNKADVCRDIGRIIHTNAVVYDWCYDLIEPGVKNSLILQMESLATRLEVIWPKLVQGSIVGHGVEAQLSRDMLACGIATYDEKPEIYQLVAGRILAEFVPARNFFYPAGYHHQGSAYGPGRFKSDLQFTLLFDKMGYPNVVSKTQGSVPYKWLYTRRPDGQLLRDGDDYNELFTRFGAYWPITSDALTASFYKDPILMCEAIKAKLIGKDPLYDFLLVDPTVPVHTNKSQLPLTRYFKAPLGAMVARTGWGDSISSNTVVAEMKIGEYNFVNHQHLDAGSFQIYYKGPLAIKSGIYQGTNGGYGSDHFINYYQRTIAHNSMLVYDPREKFTWHGRPIVNDGGQQFPNGGAEPLNMDAFLKNDYKTGEVLAQGFGPDNIQPDYSYIKGELAEAYGSKVKSFRRSFVFLNLFNATVPAALIIFDRVIASDSNFKKTWLLHSVEEPLVDGITTRINRHEKGYKGSLVNTTLLPLSSNLLLNKVGGKDNAYSVNGINYPQQITAKDNSGDGATWRMELSAKNPALTDNFLNVLQVMDYNDGHIKTLGVDKVETGNMVGTAIGNRMVLFNKNSEVSGEPIRININKDGIIKVLITDIANGEWQLRHTNTKRNIPAILICNNNQLYFNATRGTYLLVKK